jgi:putative component of membrane protein insertase Oxa1/YidC/SpoIIIJ protein YidD
MRYVGVGAVWVYRFTLAPFLGVGQCKYHPSCSQYAIDAYKEFGLFKGSRGGVDYARDQKVFR